MSRTRAKRPVRNPFVVTLAAATAILAPACGARVDGVSSDAGTDSQPIECPNGVPSHGEACSGSVTCNYSDRCGSYSGGGTIARCENGEWQVLMSTCNPPPPECPREAPTAGTPCAYFGEACSYADRCMPGWKLEFTCNAGRWQAEGPPVAVACPTTPPVNGSSCAECAGRYPSTCVYEYCGGSPSREAMCDPVTKTWSQRWLSCNPPAPEDAGSPEPYEEAP